jgi:putative heme-binding domain-containing protein
LLPTQPRAAGKDVRQPVRNFPKGLSLELLRQLLSVNDSTLSLEVVRTLAGNASVSQELLSSIAGDSGQSEALRAEAIAGLAAVAEQHTELLFRLVGDDRQLVREGALRCLRSGKRSSDQVSRLREVARQYPESADLVQAALAPNSLKADRPAVTDTKAWLKILDAIDIPADPESGRRIFHHARLASCSNCHRHNGRGNVVGPDLSGQGKQNERERLLKSILNPSGDIAPEYQPRTILLNDGRVFTGIRLRSYTKEQIRDAHGQTRTFERGDVESMVDSNVSFMPSGLVDLLTIRELRDLIAFLQSDAGNEGDGQKQSAAPQQPLVRVVDLNVGEATQLNLCNGQEVEVKLMNLVETRDPIRQAVRSAKVTVKVDGEEITLESGMYNLPRQIAGVQIDCSITKGYNSNGTPSFWGLDKDARLRLWPADSPLLSPGSLIYPVDQRWFATRTWFDNEPVDGGTKILPKIYYHSGLDIGGSERQVKVIAATDAVVVSSGEDVLPEYLLKGGTTAKYGQGKSPVAPRNDVVYLKDGRGWFYRYSHLHKINDAIRPGRIIDQGTEIGLLGKKGSSGGWSHLHFEIKSRQPSGKWGTQAGYAFLWEAYRNQYKPPLVANTRRKSFLMAGDDATLDGSKSYSATDSIQDHEWTFSDGTTASGPRVTRTYDRPGVFSEILKVTDKAGNVDYDFAEVHVLDPKQPDLYVPRIHAAYWPTLGNRVNASITFKVRSFGNQDRNEVWDFGDGSPPVSVKSDGNAEQQAKEGYAITHHTYQQPGDYLVRVQRIRNDGVTATARLHVRVADEE